MPFWRRRGAGLDLEFLQRIRKRHGQIRLSDAGCCDWRRPACSSIRCSIRLRPKRSPLANGSLLLPVDRGAGVAARRARSSSTTFRPFSGRFENACVLDNLADTDASCFHQSGVRLNFDLLGDLADFQNGIDDRTAVDLQHDSRLHKRPESRQRRFQPIWTDRQVRQDIRTRFIGDGRPA